MLFGPSTVMFDGQRLIRISSTLLWDNISGHARVFLLKRLDKFRTRIQRPHMIVGVSRNFEEIFTNPLTIGVIEQQWRRITDGFSIRVKRRDINPGPAIVYL